MGTIRLRTRLIVVALGVTAALTFRACVPCSVGHLLPVVPAHCRGTE